MKFIYSILLALCCFASSKAQEHSSIYKAWIFVQYDSVGNVIKPLQDRIGHVKLKIYPNGSYSYSIGNSYSGSLAIKSDSIEWGHPIHTLVAYSGEVGYWEHFFDTKIWMVNKVKTGYRVSQDSLYINNSLGQHWVFVDSSAFDFSKLIPERVAPIHPTINRDFSIPDSIQRYMFSSAKRDIDTIVLATNDHYYSLDEYFWNVNTHHLLNNDTLVYREKKHLKLLLSENISLHAIVLDSTVRFLYYQKGRGFSDGGLAFRYRNGGYCGIQSYGDSLYTSSDKFPLATTLKTIKVNGVNYDFVSIFEAGTIKYPNQQSFVMENPITRIYWVEGIGPIQIEYKDGTRKYLLKQN